MELNSSIGGQSPCVPPIWGATKQEWALFAARLQLLPDLLPLVSNPNATISAKSAIKKPGKLPSIYNRQGELAGIAKWTAVHATAGDLKRWMAQSDYGICVQTRNVRAIDVDVSDEDKAEGIRKILERILGPLPTRGRSNTKRFLAVFRLEGDFTKRFMGKAEDDNLVEFLATGQQFVAAGTHPTGVRYEWSPNITCGIPTVTASQFEEAWSAIGMYHLGSVPLSMAKAKKLEINNDLIGGNEYPPSSAMQVAEKCAQIRLFSTTGCDFEPHWRACLGLVKATNEGEELAHLWSQNSSDYDQHETQKKLDNWTTGPATCAAFQNYGDLCKGCKFLGKVTSPIQLGQKKTEGEVTVEHEVEALPDESESDEPPTITIDEETLRLPKPFCLYGSQLCFQKEVDGIPIHIPVCDVLFYLKDRIKNVDGTTSYIVKARIRKAADKWSWSTIELDAATLGSGGRDMFKSLASYEIVPLSTGREYMELYVKSYMDELRRKKDEINSYRTYGWNPNGFVMGTELISPNKEPQKIVLGGGSAPGYLNAFTKNSRRDRDADKWAELMQQAYDHAGHEHYQLVLAAGFGSVLAHFSEIDMGGPIALYGGAGKGKTTVCKMALSIWGKPENMMISDPKDGSTANALYARMSAMHSFPWLVDEVTKLSGMELSSFAYHMSNAQPKDALTKDRKRQEPLPPWCNMGFLTSNDSPNEKIGALVQDGTAQMSRLLEIEWNNKVHTIAMHDMELILERVESVQGAAGRRFIQFVVDHKDEIRTFMRTLRRNIDNEIGLTKEKRFWSVQAMCIIAGGLVAHKLGLFPFSTKALSDTVKNVLRHNMGNMSERTNSPLEAFNNMINFFAAQTISTQSEGDSRANEMRIDVRCVGEPVARVIRDLGVMYISTSGIREWCSKRQIGYNQMKKDLQDEGILLDTTMKFVLGKGTTLSTGQVYCWRLDWNKIQGVSSSKVAHLKLVDTA